MESSYAQASSDATQGAPADPGPGRRRGLSVRMILVGIVVVVAAAAALVEGLNLWAGTAPPTRRARPFTTVGTAAAAKGDVPIVISALGTATPTATVTVNARVSGTIQKVYFTEGDHVDAGQLLAQVDPRPYAAALEQAQGQQKRDEAQLQNARADLERYTALVKQDSISRQQADTQAALVRQYEGVVAADKASVDAATLNLSYTRITAPISGRAGLRQIDAGNYIGAGGAGGIVVLTNTQPMDVVFTLPEDQAPSVVARLKTGDSLAVTALDRAGEKTLAQGKLLTLDNVIDAATGTLRAKARFANDDGALLANQFVNIRLLVDTLHDAVIVPAASVRQGPNGPFVWVLKPDKTATMRSIKLGPASGEQASIASGVEPGETVITEGGDNLREGAPVALPGARPAGGFGGPGGPGGRGKGRRPGGPGGPNGAAPGGDQPASSDGATSRPEGEGRRMRSQAGGGPTGDQTGGRQGSSPQGQPGGGSPRQP